MTEMPLICQIPLIRQASAHSSTTRGLNEHSKNRQRPLSESHLHSIGFSCPWQGGASKARLAAPCIRMRHPNHRLGRRSRSKAREDDLGETVLHFVTSLPTMP